ncbi:putative fructose-like phosphotransferase system subunit EIIA [Bythopirellula goksoeyrii]|uniref:Putative fructose-like phosphotransferase system subunit EIIA n=1 Tax=Bythopirellula goksoeyrii TaxID=1400387 RepID=A0A5B9Q512_9BACT|nr:putative fructose-like phosphotransferase system subunit EIIA [Bythopirellula goksoeyrii]
MLVGVALASTRKSIVAEEDFDISSLAAYLHMLPAQIIRLAERGKIPARRVGGDWRFSAHEVHLWLEDRIGLSDDSELAQMETNLERTTKETNGEISIAELLPEDAIAIPLAARTRGSVISAMADLACNTGLLWDPAKMADAVAAREDMHPTALDIGVALLHPRRPQSSILGGSILALGITSQGIPFGGTSGLTDVFFLICATDDHEHLRILARLSRMITDADWLAELREATDSKNAHSLIATRDASLST